MQESFKRIFQRIIPDFPSSRVETLAQSSNEHVHIPDTKIFEWKIIAYFIKMLI